jgi:hypothetical protein
VGGFTAAISKTFDDYDPNVFHATQPRDAEPMVMQITL